MTGGSGQNRDSKAANHPSDFMANAEYDVPAIVVRDVGFSYDGPPVLEDVNLSIGEREAVCIVGPNGGGKTTLVKLILGLLTPKRGEVRVFGQPPHRSRLRIGYMPQHAQFDPQFPVTVVDLVLMGRLGEGRPASDGASRGAAGEPAVADGGDGRGPPSRGAASPSGWRGLPAGTRGPTAGPPSTRWTRWAWPISGGSPSRHFPAGSGSGC